MVDLDSNGNLDVAQRSGPSTISIRPIYHERNTGKGGGLQTGFAAVTGDLLVRQNADAEYDPSDRQQMYDLIATRGITDVGLWLSLLWAPTPLPLLPSLFG
jgi:hypothetical protein